MHYWTKEKSIHLSPKFFQPKLGPHEVAASELNETRNGYSIQSAEFSKNVYSISSTTQLQQLASKVRLIKVASAEGLTMVNCEDKTSF